MTKELFAGRILYRSEQDYCLWASRPKLAVSQCSETLFRISIELYSYPVKKAINPHWQANTRRCGVPRLQSRSVLSSFLLLREPQMNGRARENCLDIYQDVSQQTKR
jgi:hypothetical protein